MELEPAWRPHPEGAYGALYLRRHIYIDAETYFTRRFHAHLLQNLLHLPLRRRGDDRMIELLIRIQIPGDFQSPGDIKNTLRTERIGGMAGFGILPAVQRRTPKPGSAYHFSAIHLETQHTGRSGGTDTIFVGNHRHLVPGRLKRARTTGHQQKRRNNQNTAE